MIITSKTPLMIYLYEDIPSSIQLAFESLCRDLEAIFVKPRRIDNENEADIILKVKPLSHTEEYQLSITSNHIEIIGNDDLGLIFGIYTFLEDILKISPSYLMEGLVLEHIDYLNLEDITLNDYPKTRFRGWFVNDEDLLSKFKSLGKRDIDYIFYNDIIHPDMMDKIAETVLRFKMNLIIPSTLIDITNPNEEKLVEVCSKRGLYISQHHIEPLGVSKFGFSKYAKQHNLKDGFSYVSNKENLVSCWKYYLSKWSKYPRVIFQAGLRGGVDRPVWTSENMSTSPIDRGNLISSAINEQCKLIKEIYPYEINITSTLWMEGADLLNGGYLHIDPSIIIVFADVGMSQLFGEDFFSVPRDNNTKYGVYYHAAFVHTGPHLAEGVLPEKMDYCYKLINQYKSNYYSILNVCNIKDICFSIYLNSKLTWNNLVSLDDIMNDYSSLYFKNEDKTKFIESIKTYYKSLGDVGEDQYERFCKRYDFSYKKYDSLPFPVLSMNDGMFRAIIYCFYYEQRFPFITPRLREVCAEGLPLAEEAFSSFKTLSESLKVGYKVGFNEHWTYESLFWIHIFKSGIYFYDAIALLKEKKYDDAQKLLELCSNELNAILEDRKTYFVGEYKDWFNDERKIDIKFLAKRVLEEVDRAKQVQK